MKFKKIQVNTEDTTLTYKNAEFEINETALLVEHESIYHNAPVITIIPWANIVRVDCYQ